MISKHQPPLSTRIRLSLGGVCHHFAKACVNSQNGGWSSVSHTSQAFVYSGFEWRFILFLSPCWFHIVMNNWARAGDISYEGSQNTGCISSNCHAGITLKNVWIIYKCIFMSCSKIVCTLPILNTNMWTRAETELIESIQLFTRCEFRKFGSRQAKPITRCGQEQEDKLVGPLRLNGTLNYLVHRGGGSLVCRGGNQVWNGQCWT